MVSASRASPDFERKQLWDYCARECKWQLCNPGEHGEHGIEQIRGGVHGVYRINFVYEQDREAARKKFQHKSPLGLELVTGESVGAASDGGADRSARGHVSATRFVSTYDGIDPRSVSYTHLTLPTICSV